MQTIGAKLGVARLRGGSVRHQGDTVRIIAERINTRDGSNLWSRHCHRPYKGLFALQDEITHAFATRELPPEASILLPIRNA